MNLSRRFLRPGTWLVVFITLVLLVVVGLGWVTALSLQVEADQREATARAERSNLERLALWRMDGLLLPTMGLENHRPFAHYTALHAATTAVDFTNNDNQLQGSVRLPSPLLSVDLPAWLPLHFQLDAEQGWDSPQVLPAEIHERLRNAPNWLDLPNVTPERQRRLMTLRETFPADMVLPKLAALDSLAGEGSLFIVPVPLTSEPSLPKPVAKDEDCVIAKAPPLDALRKSLSSEQSSAVTVQPGFARSNSTVIGDEPVNNMNNLKSTAPPAGANPPSPATGLGGGVPQAGRGGDPNSDEYQARMRAAKQAMDKPGTQDNRSNPNGGIGGGQGVPGPGFGGGGQSGIGGGFGGGFGSPQMPNGLQNSPAPGGPPAQLAMNKDLAKNDNRVLETANSRAGNVYLSDALMPGVRAAKKGPPTLAPVAVHVGPLRAEWLTNSQGVMMLILFRAAHLEAKTIYQGVVLDWPLLETRLKEHISDLFPDAKLTPLLNPDPLAPDRAMTALPVQLDPGPLPTLPPMHTSPLRLGLLLAWCAAFLAITAVGFGGRTLLDLSERRIRFVSAVTHELRTPLTSLRLYLDLLNSGMVDDPVKQKEYLQTLVGESDRLHRLIENVLDFAKLEKRRVTANVTPTDVQSLLDNLQQTWADRCLADGKDLVIHSLLAPGQMVRTDARMVEQIIGNLIDNAKKYSREASDNRIWLWAKPAERGRVILEVEDRGPGIPNAERSTLFSPFRRGETADTTAGGAGLGLALAQQWAELLSGHLTYHPAPGGTGSTFRLELPTG